MRRAGYDGVVLGRAYPGASGRKLVEAIAQEEPLQRLVEPIHVYFDGAPGDRAGGGASIFGP